MTDKPKTKRRSVSKARLYKELEAFCSEHGVAHDQPISVVLDELKEAIVADAIK